jgi:hypothetical protein
MAAGKNWSPAEVDATVMDYMAMLRYELLGQAYNKAEHRRALLRKLSGRSEAAVELKHQNISAVLQDLGYFWIPGYKPRSNYQQLLADTVEMWVAKNPEIDRFAEVAAETPAATPEHFDFDAFETARPTVKATEAREDAGSYGNRSKVRIRCDYAAREARNSSLGRAGEELVVHYEQYRLSRLGLDRLADKVQHISRSEGDGAGFDVLSFEADGREKFVEVKTTAFARETPFFASSAEIRFSKQNAGQYALYRLFEFRKNPKCYALSGAIADHCALDPVSYRCSLR